MREQFFHLARIALSGRQQDVHTFLHRVAKKSGDRDLSNQIQNLLNKSGARSSPLRRKAEVAMPVDSESRFHLLRVEDRPSLNREPIYNEELGKTLRRLVGERANTETLAKAGLEPTRAALFTGPPGVGKTLAARWIARELNYPLLILDLSSVMSSFLGRTGSNLRQVLEYAKSSPCVLLLDELDAIAKRRDDTGEIGELKRLVTVLLQQLDDWPSTSILLAATNHAALLDPAVWRRFEEVVEFELPKQHAASDFITSLLQGSCADPTEWANVLSIALAGQSFSEIEHKLNSARRAAAIKGGDLAEYLPDLLQMDERPSGERIDAAIQLVRTGLVSQRRAHELTGVARETIRKRLKELPV